MAHPWLKFYPRDWRGDQALRACSVSARGLWMEMLCIMHEASPYGHLILGGRAVSNDMLARMAGLGVEECGALISELESAGVLSRTRKAIIYSRRMVKDHSRAEKGRKSVNKRWGQGAENNKENAAPNRSPNRKPITQKPEARKKNPSGKKKPMPDGWKPEPFGAGTSCRAIVDGWSASEAERQFERFAAHHQRNGNKWEDWHAAWKTWVLNSPDFSRSKPVANEGSFLDHLREERRRTATT